MSYNPYLLLGVLAGVAVRTLVPYLLSGKPWEWRYISSAVWGAFVAIVGGTLALPVIDPSASPTAAFTLGLFAAISLQTGARQVEKAVNNGAK